MPSKYILIFGACIFPYSQLVLAESPDVKLSIKPVVCHVEQQGDSCDISVNVVWQSAKPITTCLYRNEIKTQCWENVDAVETALALSFSENQLFTLKDKQSVIAKQLLAVHSVKAQIGKKKKYRRRLRADWSLF